MNLQKCDVEVAILDNKNMRILGLTYTTGSFPGKTKGCLFFCLALYYCLERWYPRLSLPAVMLARGDSAGQSSGIPQHVERGTRQSARRRIRGGGGIAEWTLSQKLRGILSITNDKPEKTWIIWKSFPNSSSGSTCITNYFYVVGNSYIRFELLHTFLTEFLSSSGAALWINK
jgi:hypothetical protein